MAPSIYTPDRDTTRGAFFLSQLPLITSAVNDMTDSAEEQRGVNLQRTEGEPHILEHATVDWLVQVVAYV